jgi:hypothetical protein
MTPRPQGITGVTVIRNAFSLSYPDDGTDDILSFKTKWMKKVGRT